MDTISNCTDDVFRLTYWKSVLSGLNENITININPYSIMQIPQDYCIDEFIVLSENYDNRIFKFCLEKTYITKTKILLYSDNYDVTLSDNILCINKYIK
jgi:hypothetical protein